MDWTDTEKITHRAGDVSAGTMTLIADLERQYRAEHGGVPIGAGYVSGRDRWITDRLRRQFGRDHPDCRAWVRSRVRAETDRIDAITEQRRRIDRYQERLRTCRTVQHRHNAARQAEQHRTATVNGRRVRVRVDRSDADGRTVRVTGAARMHVPRLKGGSTIPKTETVKLAEQQMVDDVVDHLRAMHVLIDHDPNHGITQQDAAELLNPLTMAQLRQVNEKLGYTWVAKNRAQAIHQVARNAVGDALDLYAIHPKRGVGLNNEYRRGREDAVLNAWDQVKIYIDHSARREALEKAQEAIRKARRPNPADNPYTGTLTLEDLGFSSDRPPTREDADGERTLAEMYDNKMRRGEKNDGEFTNADQAMFHHAVADYLDAVLDGKPAPAPTPAVPVPPPVPPPRQPEPAPPPVVPAGTTDSRTQTDRPTHPLLAAACDAVARAGEYQPPPIAAQVDVAWYMTSLAELDEALGDAFTHLAGYYRGVGIDGSVWAWMTQVAKGCHTVSGRQQVSAQVYEDAQSRDLERARTPTGLERRSNVG